MSKESLQQIREEQASEVQARNKLMKEYNKTRDPILLYTYKEIVKIRKWVAFMGIILILSLIVGIIIGIGAASL